MTVHLDTSVLIEIITRTRPLLVSHERAVRAGHRTAISSPVLYEWLRGPRTASDIDLQGRLFPTGQVVAFGVSEAAQAGQIYRALTRARDRDMDVAIAACAIEHGASLWTVNPRDFRDIPGLQLYEP